MFYMLVLVVYLLSRVIDSTGVTDTYLGWDYINLYCRNNDNEPVDWWFIYKLPSQPAYYMVYGMNFSFITPQESGRWHISESHLGSDTMLQHTLSPLFRPTYVDHLAYVVYEAREGNTSFPGSTAHGILMADERGGVWIGHSVPGLIDVHADQVVFPEAETLKGHMLFCMSLDLITLNDVAFTLKLAAPNFSSIHVPDTLSKDLIAWNYLLTSVRRSNWVKSPNFDFKSRHNTLKAVLMVRMPGESRCLYQDFARKKKIVLDVYGATEATKLTSYCGHKYSIRNIEKISLKLLDLVFYIAKNQDKSHFAVSTGAHWQARGEGKAKYWACVGSLGKQDTTRQGGMLLCVEDYEVWLTFDNFKIKEPEC